jgi:hypothetical protein
MEVMSLSDNEACPYCGAIGCGEKYETMLALEFEQPAVFGAVHHITVNCYNVQHPDTFSDEALTWMRTALRDIVEKDLSGRGLLKRARGMLGGDFKVRRRDKRPRPVGHARARAPGRTKWSMTVADVRTDSPEVYTGDIRAWAKSILKDLDAR